MKEVVVNAYDFDHTVYKGDASFDFITFCVLRNPKVCRHLPTQVWALVAYILGFKTRKEFKEAVFTFLKELTNTEQMVTSFWDKRVSRIAKWYTAQRLPTDVFVTASPEFLVTPMAKRLGVGEVIGTRMNIATGAITGENCRGAEKVKRFQEQLPNLRIKKCYSDHLSDRPLLELAQQGFIVSGEKLTPFREYKPARTAVFKDPAFLRFLCVGGFNASLGVLFSFLLSRVVHSPLVAFMVGYSASMLIAYFLNAVLTFKESSLTPRQFISFCTSYVPNFVILSGLVHVMINSLHAAPLVAYLSAAALAAPITFFFLSNFTFTKWQHK